MKEKKRDYRQQAAVNQSFNKKKKMFCTIKTDTLQVYCNRNELSKVQEAKKWNKKRKKNQ